MSGELRVPHSSDETNCGPFQENLVTRNLIRFPKIWVELQLGFMFKTKLYFAFSRLKCQSYIAVVVLLDGSLLTRILSILHDTSTLSLVMSCHHFRTFWDGVSCQFLDGLGVPTFVPGSWQMWRKRRSSCGWEHLKGTLRSLWYSSASPPLGQKLLGCSIRWSKRSAMTMINIDFTWFYIILQES